MVTVVDALNFLKDYDSAEDLKDRKMELGEEDQRSIAHFLVDQIEFADVILLNKADLVSKKDLKQLYGIIRSLNSEAKIIESIKSRVELDEILNTNLFDFDKASQAPGWLKVMRGEEASESDEYGVSSISFIAREPFHPERFYKFLHTEFSSLYRAKGYFWTASQPDFMAEMAIAGTVREYHPKSFWWVSMDQSEWPKDRESLIYIKKDWHEHYGDRMQKLVFIGKTEILPKIKETLQECLFKADELQENANYLLELKTRDPFGDWDKFVQQQS
jgi:G3E family GTPase